MRRGRPVQDEAQVHKRLGRAGRAFAVGVAYAVAVEAKDGMV